MTQRAVAAMAIGTGLAAMGTLAPVPAPAQPPAAATETQRVPFGGVEFVLHAPSRHCLLDTRQAVDEQLAAQFRPRAGKMNTYLAAFVDCKELAAMRQKRASFALSFGYYLAVTSGASNPLPLPRDQYVRALCEFFRANHGSLDFATAAEAARREIETQMQALQIGGAPRLGQVVAQDANGCYQLFVYKRKILTFEHREVWLTTSTLVKGRPLTYTRIMPYFNPALPLLVKSFQSEVAVLVRSNS